VRLRGKNSSFPVVCPIFLGCQSRLYFRTSKKIRPKAPYIGIAQPTKEDEGFPIIFDSTWSIATDTFKFAIPKDMKVSKKGGGVMDDANVPYELIETINNVHRSTFKLVVTNGFLCLSDSSWGNPGTNPYNVATFNNLQFEYKNLTGPAVESFNIAFQTGRS
jgi:hypothetical protein